VVNSSDRQWFVQHTARAGVRPFENPEIVQNLFIDKRISDFLLALVLHSQVRQSTFCNFA
jgi:hypothetical protein